MSKTKLVAVALIVLGALAVPAHAEMIETDQLLAPSADAQRAQVDAFLVRQDVQRELEAFGVSPADAADRAASLTEAELQVVANRIDTLPAGANTGISTLGLILIIVLIVVLI